MENLNSIDWTKRESELLEVLNDSEKLFMQCNKVWIRYTRFNSVCITVFGKNLYCRPYPYGGYMMFFGEKIQDWSIENLKKIVLSQYDYSWVGYDESLNHAIGARENFIISCEEKGLDNISEVARERYKRINPIEFLNLTNVQLINNTKNMLIKIDNMFDNMFE